VTEQESPLFQNPSLDVDQLPSVKDIRYLKLSPAYWRYAIVTTIVTFLVFLAPLAGVWIGAERWVAVLATVVWGVFFVAGLVLARYRYDIKGYVIRKHDIAYRRGIFFRRVTTIPFSRMQHCEIQEGPLERLFGLNTLLVFTAGGSSSDLAIPGLPPEEAARLRNYILRRVNDVEDEEE
jgi:membrane protein YdbS with pleckstrin-like domain